MMTAFVLLDHEQQNKWTVVIQGLKQHDNLVFQEASLKDIQALGHEGHDLWLILSAKFVSLYQARLPKISGKDIIPAIRSIVEENLAQDFSAYHCFYQTQVEGKENLLNFGLLDKAFIEAMLYFWQSHGMTITGITLDWFALNASEVLFLESGDALVHVGDLKGWMPSSLIPSRLLNTSRSFQSFCVSPIGQVDVQAQHISCAYPIWLLKRLQNKGLFDICMPTKAFHFLDKISKPQLEKLFLQISLGMLSFSVFIFLCVLLKNSSYYFGNQKQIKSYAAHANVNLEQQLLTYQRQQNQKNQFWKLFIGLQQGMLSGVQVLNLNYEASHLLLAVHARDMKVFQKFKQDLIKARLEVKESQVIVEAKGIRASIEIRGGV